MNTKINEQYEIENTVDDIAVTHNPRIRLSSLIIPYAVVLGISMIVILVYVGIRYKKLGIVKTLVTYLLSIGAAEMVLLSVIAITRFPINRLVIPIGLLLLVIVVTILGFISEKKLSQIVTAESKKK